MSIPVACTSTESPIGTLWIAASERGVVKVSYESDEPAFLHELEIAGFEPIDGETWADEACRQIDEYFAGTRTVFDVEVDLRGLGAFTREVLQAVRRVPYGEVRSYGEIADEVGRPRAARAVGTAMSRNLVSFLVPCHRIIRGNGTLGRYGSRSGVSVKRQLLRKEGIELPD